MCVCARTHSHTYTHSHTHIYTHTKAAIVLGPGDNTEGQAGARVRTTAAISSTPATSSSPNSPETLALPNSSRSGSANPAALRAAPRASSGQRSDSSSHPHRAPSRSPAGPARAHFPPPHDSSLKSAETSGVFCRASVFGSPRKPSHGRTAALERSARPQS